MCSSAYYNLSIPQLLLWIVFVSCFYAQSLGETSRPLNRAAAIDDIVQLNCSTLDPENGYWQYTTPFQSNEVRIYDGYRVVNGMTELFSVNDSVQGRFNLIFTASESTSGRYTCRPGLTLAQQSAEVIVLDTSPNCSETLTSDIITASCTIRFRGNWAPTIVWHNKNGELEANDTVTIANNRVTSFLSVPLNQTDILTCRPMFALENKPHEITAANVPDLPRANNCTVTVGSSYASSTQPTTTTTPQSPSSSIIIIVVCTMGAFALVAAFIILFLYKRKMCTVGRKNKDRSEAVAMAKAEKV